MFPLLTLSLLLPVAPALSPAVQPQDPHIRVTLSDDRVRRGDRVRVKVKTAESGHLVVLRLDAEGRVRVVFPVDPSDSTNIRGGHEFEIRGRGGRESFLVDERDGVGTVLAARSATPFKFDDFVKHGHWDYAALVVPRDSAAAAGEPALLDLVERMVGPDGHYDYDVVSYAVGPSDRRYSRRDYDVGYIGWHAPSYYRSACFDWWCDPWYGPRLGPRIGIGIGFRSPVVFGGGRHYRGRRW
jgi:hypothetical protein